MYVLVQNIGTSAHRSLLAERLAQAVYRGAEVCAQELCQRLDDTHTKGTPLWSSPPELELPPSPALPSQPLPTFTPYEKTFEVDPENLRPGVTQDLTVVEEV
jgi:hypothetical protein